jgi:hypothetical protein
VQELRRRVRAALRGPAVAAALLALVALAACSTDRGAGDLWGPSEAGTIVVQAVLVVDDVMPTLYLSRTVTPGRLPGAGDLEGGAQVVLRTETEEYPYFEHPSGTGRYVPFRLDPVRPGTTYRLEILTARGERVSASTSTPARFSADEWLLLSGDDLSTRRRLRTYAELGEGVYDAPENRLTYQDGLLEVRFAPPPAPAMQVGLFSLDPESDFVIDPSFFSEEDFETLERTNSSPPFSGEDGFLRLPWFSIFFEGRYQVKVWAVDRNWYDFVRSDPDLAGGGPGFGGSAGDAFERPVFHIEGGIGLFGSAAVDSVGFRVEP